MPVRGGVGDLGRGSFGVGARIEQVGEVPAHDLQPGGVRHGEEAIQPVLVVEPLLRGTHPQVEVGEAHGLGLGHHRRGATRLVQVMQPHALAEREAESCRGRRRRRRGRRRGLGRRGWGGFHRRGGRFPDGLGDRGRGRRGLHRRRFGGGRGTRGGDVGHVGGLVRRAHRGRRGCRGTGRPAPQGDGAAGHQQGDGGGKQNRRFEPARQVESETRHEAAPLSGYPGIETAFAPGCDAK